MLSERTRYAKRSVWRATFRSALACGCWNSDAAKPPVRSFWRASLRSKCGPPTAEPLLQRISNGPPRSRAKPAYFPVRVDAHGLPFAREFFDAVVAIDSYLYFGTDERYLPYLAQFMIFQTLRTMLPPDMIAKDF
jgi:hypothetical protein